MARNFKQNQKMRDERREQILSTALKLFAAKGLAATKISDIAVASQISQGLLYHYFSSKEAIFVELIRGAFAQMNAAALALEALPLTPRAKLEKAIRELLHSIADSEDFARYVLLITQASVSEAIPPEAQAIMASEHNVPYAVIERIIEAGQSDGSIKPFVARDLALVFWMIMKGLALHKAAQGAVFVAPDARILTSLFFSSAQNEVLQLYAASEE